MRLSSGLLLLALAVTSVPRLVEKDDRGDVEEGVNAEGLEGGMKEKKGGSLRTGCGVRSSGIRDTHCQSLVVTQNRLTFSFICTIRLNSQVRVETK